MVKYSFELIFLIKFYSKKIKIKDSLFVDHFFSFHKLIIGFHKKNDPNKKWAMIFFH